jgi:MFS transporter, DHA2 family, methylenomycin A resistance protein
VPLAVGAAAALSRVPRPAAPTARFDVRGCVLLAGVMLGLVAAVTELLLQAVGPRTGLGSALNDAVREVGGVVGVAVLGSLAVAVADPAAGGPALLDGMRAAFAVAAVVLGLAAATTARSAATTAATAPGAPAAHR